MAEEIFDIVNQDNIVIGQELRRIVHQTGLWHRGVHVFLFTPDRKLLVQKRSQTRDTFPSTLDCSVIWRQRFEACRKSWGLRVFLLLVWFNSR